MQRVDSSEATTILDDDQCVEPLSCLPSPWTQLTLASIAWVPPPSPSPPSPLSPTDAALSSPEQRFYRVTGRTHLPKHGLFGFEYRLRLIEHGANSPLRPAEEIVEMRVDRNWLTAPHGGRHVLRKPEDDLRRYPFFWWRAANGSLSGVVHHADEKDRT